ncbi:MAG: hypothetical protein US68_C0032G0006 [Candidatus Shapirobacteria bacterium GW2011_GWE1_38_10]|uniref:Uncharacterized protein n=1 Tax=Candidatus Shapirobacteria bacterium GW2011_GWE1_38_10 TaxID=1618488 RepID=A0A0G0IBT8_9BACT|nr:MAG: hypothetical protein US68_C0032G0006 [Candidatus Shapirobacteria bacterium GW2011_GWE1_38_10]
MFHYQKLRISIAFFLSILLAILFVFLAPPNQFRSHPILAAESSITPEEITVSATIGTTTSMIIYGYAPSLSKVQLTGNGISEERSAAANGYFSFDNIGTTSTASVYPELCLRAYIGKLSTQPTCIPSLPRVNHIYEIGPVILSPIISVEQNIFVLGTQVVLNGTTIPNSKVNIYLAERRINLALVSRVLAYQIPIYEVTSNNLGNFQFNLPSNSTAKWKVYAATTYLSSASPKSNTLNFTVESNISYYLKKIEETIKKTINIITTIVTTKNSDENKPNDQTGFNNISTSEVEVFRSRLTLFVIFAEGIILLLLVIIILKKTRKNNKKKAQGDHSNQTSQ